MGIKIFIFFLPLILSSCMSKMHFLSSIQCDFPLHSPYPGGVLNIPINNNNIKKESPLITGNLKFTKCRSSNKYTKIIIPIPLDFKGKKISAKQEEAFLFNEYLTEKFYRESRITISDENLVNPGDDFIPRIKEEYQLSLKAKQIYTPKRLNAWEMNIPVVGQISSEFGVRRFINDQPKNRHSGIDIYAKEGTVITAPLAGEAIIASNFFYKGNAIYINHGAGLVSSYSHLSEINIAKGDLVEQGDVIGFVGQTGRVTGPHLHWEVYLMGISINPEVFLSKPL